jgi:hypothetical protein
VAQERFGLTPFYDSEGARVGNRREYTSVVFAGAEPLGTGHGASKQEAEQDAARAALESLTGSAAAAPVSKVVKPRSRRAPRKKREEPATETASPTPAEVLAFPAPSEASTEQLAPEPRSRQFGEPIE